MDFSDQWRSLWPISSVFAAPNLLPRAASKTTGPLLFNPSSPPIPLISSPSLSLQIPPPLPPSSLLSGVHAFFGSPDNDGFLPFPAQYSLADDVLSSTTSTPDPIASNNLHSLRCGSDGSTLILFFPTGENANSIGFVALSFNSGAVELEAEDDKGGGVFVQREGFRHPYHRILKLSVAPASSSLYITAGLEPPPDSTIEGFLMATTLYSVNWFRVEMRVLDSGSARPRRRPFLVPFSKQGFDRSVVDACWSPHFPEESAALLDDGELCWFNMNTKSGGKVKVLVGDGYPGEWLSCKYGGQPWILIVACSVGVVWVDLRSMADALPNILVRIDMVSSNCVGFPMEEGDRILAFRKADFNNFHLAVVSERQLFLFDVRQPLVPILTWDHGLDRPQHVVMFRLSELRPLQDEFSWASEAGFAILVGSFWDDDFNLFCYGPKDGGAHSGSSLYAWELPSYFPLSGRLRGSGNNLVKEIFSTEDSPDGVGWQRKDVVVGFCLVPDDLLKQKAEPGGFTLVRLMLSGKLEMQSYCAYWDSFVDESNDKDRDLVERKVSLLHCTNQEGSISTRYSFVKLRYLYEYLNGNLSNALDKHDLRLCHKQVDQNSINHDLMDLSNKLKSSSSSISLFVSDATIPTSVFEIASRRVLSRLQSQLLALSFSKYLDPYGIPGYFPVEFLEVPDRLPHHMLPPFFVVQPSSRSDKHTKKASRQEALVGPVIPLPVLLTLQEMDKEDTRLGNEPEDDLLAHQCKTVLENVFPETSIMDSGNGWDASQEMHDEKPFFVYEPKQMYHRGSNLKSRMTTHAGIEEHTMDPLNQFSYVPGNDDKRFTTFICGIDEKRSFLETGKDPVGLEMLNLSPVKLDFDSSTVDFQPREHQIFKCLKRQFTKWQDGYKPYQDFCTSSKIHKQAQ